MTEQRKRLQELNMLIAKRKDYLSFLQKEKESTQDDLCKFLVEYEQLVKENKNV